MSSLPKLPTTTWGTESDANRIKKTYVKGYMDVSGGELSVHNTAFNVFNSNGNGVFRMDPQKMTVNDSTGQEVDISLSYLTFLNVLVPPDGKAVSIPDKVKYIFTVGTETRVGKSDASSNFRVYGNTYVEENLFVNMDASFGQRFLLMGDASLNSNLYVKSNTRMDGDLSLNNRLFVSKDVSLNSNLYVKSNTWMDGDLSLNNRLFVLKDASLNGNLYVCGRTTFYEPSGSVITDGTSRGTLNLTHGDASGGSSILFQSVNSQDNDYAYIQYQENVPYAGQTTTESGLLTIGIENEITGVNRDRISLWAANGSGNVGINTKFPNYNLDVSGQIRICEGTGTIASATTGSMILEHTAVGGTSSIMFKGPNSTTNDYAYIQYEDNTAYTLPVLKYDFSANSGTTFTSTGSNTAILTKAGVPANITSVAVSGLTPLPNPNNFPAGISCIRFNQTNLTVGSGDTIAYLQTSASPFTAGGFTFSAWIRPVITNVANCRFYILNISPPPDSNISNFSIHFGGGEIAALIGDDSTNFITTADNLLTSNTWVHYAFTFDNATSTGRHYINGNLNGGTNYGNGYLGKQLTAINQNILIGLKYGYNTGEQIPSTGIYAKGFHGYMNYVNMFDRALSITEIAVLYNTPGYTQSTINRGLMTFGIENEPGAVFNDRIALMPANGSGFVGINTKTPTCALDVNGSINAGGDLNFTGPYAANGKTPKIQFNVTNLGKAYINCIGGPTGSEVNNTRLQFVVTPNSGSDIEALTINTKTGNVGIGTTTPFYRLSLGQLNANCKLAVYDDGTGSNWYGIGANASNLTFGAGLTQAGTPQMVLSSTGRLGIGTTTPGSMLDVNGSLKAGETTITGATNINTTGSAATNIGATGTTTTFAGSVKGPTPAADDQYELATTNWVIAKGYSTGIGMNPTFTTVTADSFNAASDYRIKTDVKPLDASFNIDVLKPVTYTNTRHGRQDVGFIAHEVQEHYPFLVNGEKDGEQMQSLNYIGLIGILTKEIQDLKRRLAETEAKVASVETDVRTIETKVEEVDDIIISVEDNVLSVKNAVSSIENTVSSVENKVSSVENTVSSVENTVLLEQARLTICETEIALNKSAIKDLDERLQS
jgi:hypothetical protein